MIHKLLKEGRESCTDFIELKLLDAVPHFFEDGGALTLRCSGCSFEEREQWEHVIS